MIYAKGGEHSVQAVGHQNRAAAGVRQVLQLPDLLGQGQHLPNHRAREPGVVPWGQAKLRREPAQVSVMSVCVSFIHFSNCRYHDDSIGAIWC